MYAFFHITTLNQPLETIKLELEAYITNICSIPFLKIEIERGVSSKCQTTTATKVNHNCQVYVSLIRKSTWAIIKMTHLESSKILLLERDFGTFGSQEEPQRNVLNSDL